MDRRWDPVRDLIRPQKKDLIALSFEHNHEIRREIDEIYVSDLHFQSGFFFYQSFMQHITFIHLYLLR